MGSVPRFSAVLVLLAGNVVPHWPVGREREGWNISMTLITNRWRMEDGRAAHGSRLEEAQSVSSACKSACLRVSFRVSPPPWVGGRFPTSPQSTVVTPTSGTAERDRRRGKLGNGPEAWGRAPVSAVERQEEGRQKTPKTRKLGSWASGERDTSHRGLAWTALQLGELQSPRGRQSKAKVKKTMRKI